MLLSDALSYIFLCEISGYKESVCLCLELLSILNMEELTRLERVGDYDIRVLGRKGV
jgi:hypothetical protein